MGNINEHRDDGGLALEEARPKLKEPSMYKVFLLNDDFTPMEFVVTLLEQLFGMDREKATRVMLQVHSNGKGICGVYTYEIAETKVAQVSEYAQQHQHPLMCSMEEA
ncbi:MAG: ATP-dependent Clp protease adapter ClpS [Gammaproteobacteria bacterium]|jgi:ATP-dependent Clp protease adaptor protein ClpS|nr:ATP-dependent Clp protease adapter ClpS [Gammaproteobacteria bacterium]MDH5515283.1 ATP-dependent Clp protease adapter ClpS [Gammaproteobacteria bacterium]HSG10136.1 ATP-dependent Clp protease adapter ClpS [Gammaproteobacteria bacterium]